MKKTVSMLLAVLFCITALMLASCGGSIEPATSPTGSANQSKTPDKTATPTPQPTVQPTETPTAQPTETPTAQPTATPTETAEPTTTVVIDELADKIFSSIKRNIANYEHKTLETLPSSYTLVGTDYLPAVYERGELQNDAADAVAYMQYTNAVAQYVKNLDPTSTWNPSKDFNSCFSSKYTGQYSAESTWGIYDILRDNGCLTNAQDDYKRDAHGLPIIKEAGKYSTKTTGWLVDEGIGDTAYQYRLRNYEYVYTGNSESIVEADGYYDTHDKGIHITDSNNGLKFLDKIRDAIATGNIVVVRGTYETWQYETFTDASAGAKAGDTVIAFSLKLSDADAKEAHSYNLCIVGYDDNISYTTHEVTTKGAFLVCNPGDPSWGKNGYAWLMYDALNTNCPLKTEEGKNAFVLEEEQERVATVNYYFFTYWDKDITTDKPTLYAEVELETANRSAFTFYMTKTDAFGRNSQIEAYQTYHMRIKEYEAYGLDQEDTTQFFNPTGTLNGKSVKGYYTISFERLLTNLPENTTFEDFALGLKIVSSDAENPVTVKSIKFKNSAGEVIKTVTMPKNTTIANTEMLIRIDFGKQLTPDIIVGNFYSFQNVKTGAYLTKTKDLPQITLDKFNAKTICLFHVTYDSSKDLYKFYWKEGTSKYIQPLDISGKSLKDGVQVYVNPKDVVGRETNSWYVSYNSDGTFCIYLKNEAKEIFALASPESGKTPVLKQVTEESGVTDDIKWNLYTDYDGTYRAPMNCTVTTDGNKLHIESNELKTTSESVKISVYGINGKSAIAQAEATVTDKKVVADVEVENLPEEYFIVITNTEEVEGKTVTKFVINSTLVIKLGE